MSHNTFGHLFRVTTWGESHGPALGCVVDGCPPGLSLTEADIQHWLDRRRPGSSRFVTQRQEPDQARILSGVFSDDLTGGQVTTGTPISLMIENLDARSRDYSKIARQFRPGHADYAYFAKYGVRDYRGGGRSSARETAARVAFKPTSSIPTDRRSVDETGQDVDVATTGRHDPCVAIRAAPVVEAMTACVLADAFLRHRGQTGGGAFTPGREGRS